MEHERTLDLDCVGGDDDDAEEDDKFVVTDDDCRGKGVKDRTYVQNYLFYVMYGAGVVLFWCLLGVNWWGSKSFRRAKEWLHGEGGAKIVLLEEGEVNLIFVAVFAVCSSTLIGER